MIMMFLFSDTINEIAVRDSNLHFASIICEQNLNVKFNPKLNYYIYIIPNPFPLYIEHL